jgi:hypothetical protein
MLRRRGAMRSSCRGLAAGRTLPNAAAAIRRWRDIHRIGHRDLDSRGLGRLTGLWSRGQWASDQSFGLTELGARLGNESLDGACDVRDRPCHAFFPAHRGALILPRDRERAFRSFALRRLAGSCFHVNFFGSDREILEQRGTQPPFHFPLGPCVPRAVVFGPSTNESRLVARKRLR